MNKLFRLNGGFIRNQRIFNGNPDYLGWLDDQGCEDGSFLGELMSQNQLMQDCPKGTNFNELGSSFSSPVVIIRDGVCSHSGWLWDDNSCEFYNELKVSKEVF